MDRSPYDTLIALEEFIPTCMPMLKCFVDKDPGRYSCKRVYENEHSLYVIVRVRIALFADASFKAQVCDATKLNAYSTVWFKNKFGDEAIWRFGDYPIFKLSNFQIVIPFSNSLQDLQSLL